MDYEKKYKETLERARECVMGYTERPTESQNCWKPSEEQICALADALSLAESCGEERSNALRTLYEQLKNLKE